MSVAPTNCSLDDKPIQRRNDVICFGAPITESFPRQNGHVSVEDHPHSPDCGTRRRFDPRFQERHRWQLLRNAKGTKGIPSCRMML
jgi:hypothetical protein